MKNKSIIFIVICMLLCLIPSVGMLFFPTTETTENKAMAAAPQLITEEGTLNKSFIADFEAYFTEHIALRNPLVYADAMIQTGVFQTSNVSGVIDGTDGWLYYSSTLSDYLGTDVLSDNDLSHLSNNFRIVQDYLAGHGIDFVLTIAPNKNTLYGENMPYYSSCIVEEEHSAKLLAPYLREKNVRYLDLFELFEAQDEVLYLLRDSHWNMKGACLAYNAIMDSLDLPHRDYADPAPVLVKNENGDLSKMLYSFYGQREENYAYEIPETYVYTGNGTDVEAGWIVTENPEGQGTLLMFRDSFANTLIPFLSSEFKTACYSKSIPGGLERYLETYQPDCVVIEKVERNITDYLVNPPILTAPATELPMNLSISKTETTLQVESCLNDVNYYKFTGTADPQRVTLDSEILVRVGNNVHRAYLTEGNNYLLYLKKADLSAPTVDAQVYILTGDSCVQALFATLELPQ